MAEGPEILIEDKPTAPRLSTPSKGSVSGIILIEPDGSKFAGTTRCNQLLGSGNVWLPHPDWSDHLFRGDGKVKELVGELYGHSRPAPMTTKSTPRPSVAACSRCSTS